VIGFNLRRLSSFAAAAALSVLGCSPATAPTGDVVARWIADDPETYLAATDIATTRFEADLLPTPTESLDGWRSHHLRILGLEEGRLALARDGADPWVAVDVELDADTIAAVEVEIDNPGPAETQLFWAGPRQRFDMSRMMRPSSSRATASGAVRYRFDVGNHPAWRGPLRSLRIDPSPVGDGPVRLQAFRLFRWELDSAKTAEISSRPWKISLGRSARNALPAPPGAAWRHTVTVPEGAALNTSCGLQRNPGGPTTFRITAEADGGPPAILLEKTVHRQDRWLDLGVNLAAYAGRRVTFTLSTETESGGESALGLPVWGNPEILAPRRGDPPLNVVIVLLDTLRADRLSCYGHRLETSPRMDRWASSSAVRFANVVAPAPWTLPSHASIFTGLDALRHGFNWWGRAPDSLEMGAEVFRRAGYTTAAFTGGGVLHPSLGFAQGFDSFTAWDEPDSRNEVAWVFDSARAWLDANRDRRFFLFVHTYETHAPHRRRQPHFRRLARAAGITPASFELDLVTGPWDGLVSSGDHFVVNRPGPGEWRSELSNAELRTVSLMYDSAVATVDAEVGALLDHLDGLGLAENTIVVVTSDHGEALGEDGRAGHVYLDDYNLMVPLLISVPHLHRGRTVIDEQIRLLDLMPTLLDAAGLATSSPVDGRSLLPLVNGDDDPPRPAWAYAASSNRGLALRLDNRLKYVFPDAAWAEIAHRESLHELVEDPHEERNLAPEDPRLDTFRSRTRSTILEQHRGLRLEIRCAPGRRLAGRLTGGWAVHNKVKTADHTADRVHWTAEAQAAFDIGPGETATLLFTRLDSADAGIELLDAMDGSGAPRRIDIDLAAIRTPAAWRLGSGGWRFEEAYGGGVETGFLITRAGEPQPVTTEGMPVDAGVVEQLEALGYVE
jgi:arylsulfatase A-like enzyme